jgi:hypothetical protein
MVTGVFGRDGSANVPAIARRFFTFVINYPSLGKDQGRNVAAPALLHYLTGFAI